jgi:hypothetical protein
LNIVRGLLEPVLVAGEDDLLVIDNPAHEGVVKRRNDPRAGDGAVALVHRVSQASRCKINSSASNLHILEYPARGGRLGKKKCGDEQEGLHGDSSIGWGAGYARLRMMLGR